MLETRPELQVVGRVSDGLEAVHKAEELRPDLIVLDIGLPSLNGIDAARQIRELSPNSKILFLSQETSADLVQEALGLGALGYVVKTHAGTELLVAVEVVCQGRQFVSSGLSSHHFTDAKHAHTEIARNHVQRYAVTFLILIAFQERDHHAFRLPVALIPEACENYMFATPSEEWNLDREPSILHRHFAGLSKLLLLLLP